MKRLIVSMGVLVLLCLIADTADGRPRRWRRARSNTPTYTTTSYSNWGSTPQEVADAKARYLASRNWMGHPGGGYGGGAAEGVGAGMTPAQALGNCCFSGQRPILGQAVYQGSSGMWYAVRIFR